MFGLDPEIAYHLERQQKQNFLTEEIANKGFDPVEFAQFIDTKKENGTDIDNWTIPELQAVVYEFQSYYGAPQQSYPTEADQKQLYDQPGYDQAAYEQPADQ